MFLIRSSFAISTSAIFEIKGDDCSIQRKSFETKILYALSENSLVRIGYFIENVSNIFYRSKGNIDQFI